MSLRLLVIIVVIATGVMGQEWSLGTTQVGGFAGINAGEGRSGMGTVQPSFGAGTTIGLSRYFAITANYGYNRIGTVDDVVCTYGTCVPVSAKAVMHEVLAGGRFNGTNSSRVTPYFTGLAGMVRATASGSAMGFTGGFSEIKPAFGGGGGFDIGIGSAVVSFDVRMVKPLDMNWYARAAAGVAFRFGGSSGGVRTPPTVPTTIERSAAPLPPPAPTTSPAPRVAASDPPQALRQNTADTRPRVTVESDPAGASVYVNDYTAGVTPVTFPLEPGIYKFVILIGGYKPWVGKVEITPDKSAFIKASLAPAQ